MSAYEENAAELVTLVDKATAEELSGPEWQLNLMVCDAVNAAPALYVSHKQGKGKNVPS
jgi:hypothetical protein